MAENVTVWGSNGIELEIEPEWVNPLLSTGAITLENPELAAVTEELAVLAMPEEPEPVSEPVAPEPPAASEEPEPALEPETQEEAEAEPVEAEAESAQPAKRGRANQGK